jgi:hypothetical protein
VNKTHAWFCVSPVEVDVYDPVSFPFAWICQYMVAEELIFIPLWAFHQLADELGDPPQSKQVFIIANTARCGSTLLCQIFNKLPNTRYIIKVIYVQTTLNVSYFLQPC